MVPLKKLSGLTPSCLFGWLIDCSKQRLQSTKNSEYRLEKYANLQRPRVKNAK